MKSDITAVVPTMGERTLRKSLAALRRQSLKLADIVVIENVSPFVKAMNQGIKQVRTPFLLQCDADMILDPDCAETLRRFMKDGTGVSIGYLEDGLLGTIQAVKLYRTEYLQRTPFRDSVSSDSDRITEMLESGSRIAFARRPRGNHGHARDVLGRHCPAYDDPLYVWGKFSLMGSVVRKRSSYEELQGVLAALRKSKHPSAEIALIAFCNGIFKQQKRCGHKPFEETAEYRFLRDFETRTGSSNRLFAITKLEGFDPARELAKLGSR